MKLNQRFSWAISVLDIKPTEDILEIGCGSGILAEQIAVQLSSGTITAIDKSAAMIKMARKRNKNFTETGYANFIVSDFAKSALNHSYFDKIVGFNVNLFWKDPAKELELIKFYLKHNGLLYVFYQAPYDIDIKAAKPIIKKLQDSSFQVVDTIYKKMIPASAFCIVARPISG